MYLFNYIMFIVVMVMPCYVVGDITCIEVLFSKILIISNTIYAMFLSYIVCVISVNGVMFINKNIVLRIITCFL